MAEREVAPDFPEELRSPKNIAPRTEDIRLTNRSGKVDPTIRARQPRVLEQLGKAKAGYATVRELMKPRNKKPPARGGKR